MTKRPPTPEQLEELRSFIVSNRGKRNPSQLWTKYRLSVEAFDQMYEAQGGVCALCGWPGYSPLCVDHDHATGLVRGLLCKTCNNVLGDIRDCVDRLLAIIPGISESEIQRVTSYLRRAKWHSITEP